MSSDRTPTDHTPTDHTPTDHGAHLARSLLADLALCDRVLRDRDRTARELGVGMDEVLAAGRHLRAADGAAAERARLALFHLAVASRALRDGAHSPGTR